MKIFLPSICHDLAGFEALVRLWEQTKNCFLNDIDIDMNAVTWFDGDMSAAFGAILYWLGGKTNFVKLINIHSDVKDILSKNGFLSYYGYEKIPDYWGTTIPYQRFDVKDDHYFADYIEKELMSRREIPIMSQGLIKRFRESIFEIFSNAVLHSRTQKGIFSCGQFFPIRKRIDFSVSDLGISIRRNIMENIGLDLTPEDAILWATTGRNTTKMGKIPGGLGLKLLCEFIDLNDGRIQIVSDAGYWLREKKRTITSRLSSPFPGTVVCVEINTADKKSYELSPGLSESNIF
ncbi:MAG: ATP-binding protein [Acidobacteria bacterium]|jgi:hypothetical protein|nr:ATP-binding protein [Acidobacteriota bacterium]